MFGLWFDHSPSDVFCMHIRAQNAALIVRRLPTSDMVLFEVFEVLPLIRAVMDAEGKLLCSYPGPAIQIPLDIFTEECFLQELSSFLVQMDVDRLDPSPSTDSAGHCIYDGVHPGYISELLVGILRGYGQPATIDRMTKRIGDEVLWEPESTGQLKQRRWDKLLWLQGKQVPVEKEPWRRSPLWLVLRVSLQSSLRASNLYKHFILFFHAHLLRTCVRLNLPSELLHIMRVKMTRRLSKLSPVVSHDLSQFVHDIAKVSETLLSKRWTAFQNIGSANPTLQLKGLDFVADTHISLDNSYAYLTKMLRLASHGFPRGHFIPHASRFYEVHDFTQFANGQLAKAIGQDPRIALADFELSVERNLDSWVATSTSNDDSSDVIASCILQYYAGARKLYGANPEDISVMILTIMDLWVALDILAIQECPLLKQYSPEIPSNTLHCLLLHRSSSLKRALHIEEYLCRRHREALDLPSVFSNSVDDSCFAVKYFHSSKNHQRIYEEITMHAPNRAELASLNDEWRSVLRATSQMVHELSKNIFRQDIHRSTCRKCQLNKEANALRSAIFKWSVLLSTVLAQLVSFELSPPNAFSAWRDITYLILHDVGRHSVPYPPYEGDSSQDVFSRLHSLEMKPRPCNRLSINLYQTHENTTVVDLRSSASADSRPSFGLYDRACQSWAVTSKTFSELSPSMLCASPIPESSPYRNLHHFISDTQHTPNDIIAAQAECPDEITLHEFMSFSGLRSGPRLQWLNIARELASPYLSFRREEVHTLVTQAAWQLGPLSNGVREWHVDLGSSSFGNALLRELECLLEKIKGNWQEEVTLRTIGESNTFFLAFSSHPFLALICSRLLSSTNDPDVSTRSCVLLRVARNVSYRWIGEIRIGMDSTQDETSRTSLQHRLCMLAATCFSTFDVCPEHVPMTFAVEEDVSIAMQCAVIVYDNMPSSFSGDDSYFWSRMLSRQYRLLHDLESFFGQCVPLALDGAELLHSGAYDRALAQLGVDSHRRDSPSWCALPRPNSRWISCPADGAQPVHYDLLTGELLLGGRRLGRLPQNIMDHETYVKIFGHVRIRIQRPSVLYVPEMPSEKFRSSPC
jgi:hypothetical protein